MARVLGYGVGNTNGTRTFSGKVETVANDAYRFRSNDFNRRRYGGLWMVLLTLMRAYG